jgi:hypothetical protein
LTPRILEPFSFIVSNQQLICQGDTETGLSPKKFIVAGLVGNLGGFYATTIGLWLLSRPPYLTYRASGRQLAAPSTRGIPWGLALHNLKVAAVPVVLYSCVVAMKTPQVPFFHIATSFSFPFPAVMLFAGLLWGFSGGRPGYREGFY